MTNIDNLNDLPPSEADEGDDELNALLAAALDYAKVIKAKGKRMQPRREGLAVDVLLKAALAYERILRDDR